MKKKKIKHIAIDFDGTLTSCPTSYPEPGKQKWIHKLILKWIMRQQKKGVYIIINTLREGRDLILVKQWCYLQGFYPSAFNANDPILTEKWGYSRKIAAGIYIDDRNIGLFGFILRRF